MAAASEGKEEGHRKPCRACMDFKTWSRLQNEKLQSTTSSVTSPIDHAHSTDHTSLSRSDCPVDRDQLGRATWTYLHTMAAYYPDTPTSSQQKEMREMMKTFSKYYPCDDCSYHMKEWMSTHPPATSDRGAFSQWMCCMHNEVNERLGKPVFDCSKVDQRWLDGWKDGSCD